MRVVNDTNIIISSIFWSGSPYKIIRQALEENYRIIISPTILKEVRKVLKDPREKFVLTEKEVDDIVESIMLYAEVIEPTISVDVVKQDPNDNHIIACAITAKAAFIITRDNDLLVLKEYEGIMIITPEEFMSEINKSYRGILKGFGPFEKGDKLDPHKNYT